MFVQVDTRRRQRWYWATGVLVVACVSCFMVLALSPAAEQLSLVMRWGAIPARLFSLDRPWWTHITRGDVVTLATALFIHVAWVHLLSNLMFLVIFGLSSERALGSPRFLVLFLFGGTFANLVGAITLAGVHAPIIGCSGAVSAVVGAYLALFPRARLGLVLPLGLFLEFVRVPASLLIGIWVLLQLMFTYAGPGFGAVVWWCHIAGFLFGVVFALVSRGAVMRRMRG
ncbi:rhomboid family intramembrane serine protease [Oleiagrimonas sp. C23AA]|uniref:rhomboid family intramembrane serine protease n=1 Tax=Oleiagrimonas sp. C23AA TaxID=2719047 RepID=UPI001423900D|nr:rhomboid family intramembrane serine protease [Oleiagrimonas sp. C23AA]NII12213.1 rhomboid family intramembrane serine protease [Oleiagrimonas sp. C23AA]